MIFHKAYILQIKSWLGFLFLRACLHPAIKTIFNFFFYTRFNSFLAKKGKTIESLRAYSNIEEGIGLIRHSETW